MFDWKTLTQSRFFITGVIIAGVALVLLLLKLALPGRSPSDLPGQAIPVVLDTGKNPESAAGLHTPTSTLGFKAIPVNSPAESKSCVYTDQYWLTHPEAWPTVNITIRQYNYTQAQALEILRQENPETREVLLKEFFTAVLNVLIGADPWQVDSALNEASAWIEAHPPRIEISASAQQAGLALAIQLHEFNQGIAGPSLCAGNPPTFTPTPPLAPSVTPSPTANWRLLFNPSTGTPASNPLAKVPLFPTPTNFILPGPLQTATTPAYGSPLPPTSNPLATSAPTETHPIPGATPTFWAGPPTSTIPPATDTQPPPSNTARPATATPRPDTSTPRPATSTPRPDTATPRPATSTLRPATSTPQPTNPPPVTSTPLPPTLTPQPTSPPATSTPVPPTNTPKPSHTPKPTKTDRPTNAPPATNTPIPPPPTDTPLPPPPPTDTPLPPPPSDTPLPPPPSDTPIPPAPADSPTP